MTKSTQKSPSRKFAKQISEVLEGIAAKRGSSYGTPEQNNAQFQQDVAFLAYLLNTSTTNWAIANCATKIGRLRNLAQNLERHEPVFDDTVLDFINYFLFACSFNKEQTKEEQKLVSKN